MPIYLVAWVEICWHFLQHFRTLFGNCHFTVSEANHFGAIYILKVICPLYNNQINVCALIGPLIGQSAMVYCAGKLKFLWFIGW